MGVNAYFGTRITNRPHATPNYLPEKSKFEIDYYRQAFYQMLLVYEPVFSGNNMTLELYSLLMML